MDHDGDAKKFANLHYPGMHADPNEGKIVVHPDASWRFDEQIACIGEDAQKILMRRSAFLMPASPLCVRVAKKLCGMGLGRIGMLGERELTGAHDLARPVAEEKQGTLANFAKWAAAESPWVAFESFRETSIDRQASDMARGFDCVIGGGIDGQSVREAVALARGEGLPAIVALVSGRQGWCASIPAGSVCEDCLEAPALVAAGAPAFYPAIELAATWISTLSVDMALGHELRGAFAVSFDTSWVRETCELFSKPGCKKCAATK